MSDLEQKSGAVSLEASTPPLPEHSATKAPVQPWVNVGGNDSKPAETASPAGQGVAQRVAPEPPPTMAEAPAPAPKPEPKAAPEPKAKDTSPELDKVLSEMRAERDRFKDLNDRHIARERLQYLREIGAKDGVSDQALMLLAPQSDPTTAEGRAQLDAWREKSSVYFEHKQAHPNVDVKQLSEGYKSSQHGTFGADLAAKLLKSMGAKK